MWFYRAYVDTQLQSGLSSWHIFTKMPLLTPASIFPDTFDSMCVIVRVNGLHCVLNSNYTSWIISNHSGNSPTLICRFKKVTKPHNPLYVNVLRGCSVVIVSWHGFCLHSLQCYFEIKSIPALKVNYHT